MDELEEESEEVLVRQGTLKWRKFVWVVDGKEWCLNQGDLQEDRVELGVCQLLGSLLSRVEDVPGVVMQFLACVVVVFDLVDVVVVFDVVVIVVVSSVF